MVDMRSEGVVVPVAEVDRANDLDRIRQAVGASIGAIGDLDRAARVAPSYSEHPQTPVTRPHGAHYGGCRCLWRYAARASARPKPRPRNPIPAGGPR